MNKEDILREYRTKQSIRASLAIAKEELLKLEKEEIIDKYLRLLHYYNSNKSLNHETNEQILDDILAKEIIDGEVTYFCYGKNYNGHLTKIGDYYINNNPNNSINVAYYRSLNNPAVKAIIPTNKIEIFENNNEVIYSSSANPEEEYHSIRRNMILEDNPKSLILK